MPPLLFHEEFYYNHSPIVSIVKGLEPVPLSSCIDCFLLSNVFMERGFGTTEGRR